LLALKLAIMREASPPLNDRRITAYADGIVEGCRDPDGDVFDLIVDTISGLGSVDRDKLKTGSFINDLKKALPNLVRNQNKRSGLPIGRAPRRREPMGKCGPG
jgi:hypothetical protein